MSGFKGTKGPWGESRHAKGHVASIRTGRMVASCMGYTTNSDNGEHIDESLANALLVSKAPEMLEMLEKAKSILGNVGEFEIAKEIEQLIKSATEL